MRRKSYTDILGDGAKFSYFRVVDIGVVTDIGIVAHCAFPQNNKTLNAAFVGYYGLPVVKHKPRQFPVLVLFFEAVKTEMVSYQTTHSLIRISDFL